MKTPHPHQEKCLTAFFEYFENHIGNPIGVVPVGGGKSLIQAEFCKRAINLYSKTKIAIITHVTELLLQIYDEFKEQYPDANISFYADKLGHKNLTGQIILGSIQSIYKKGLNIPGGIDLLMIDECHLISNKDNSMYRTFINDLKIVNPKLKIIGMTGSNFRADSGILTEGEDRLFTDVVYQIPMLELINKGFLTPLITPQEPLKTKMSVEGVKIRGGDYVESQLQAAVDKSEITRGCVDEIIEHLKTRNKCLIFTAGIEHCKHVVEEIKSRGISCEMVVGNTPTGERNSIVNDFKFGPLKVLCCVACFTTGFNNPAIDLLVLMRPMRSPVLYLQCAGRGMRTFKGKTDCLVLDFGGVIETLGPVDTIDARILNKEKKDGEAPIKSCPKCFCVCFAGNRECPDCGFEFPINEENKKLNTQASDAAILSTQQEPITHAVHTTTYSRHPGKDGKPDTLKARYSTYSGEYSQFLCFEHMGFAREKACQWHRKMLPNMPVPNTIAEALLNPYPQAEEVTVRKNGKYFEIVSAKVKEDGLKEYLPEPKTVDILAELEDFIPF